MREAKESPTGHQRSGLAKNGFATSYVHIFQSAPYFRDPKLVYHPMTGVMRAKMKEKSRKM